MITLWHHDKKGGSLHRWIEDPAASIAITLLDVKPTNQMQQEKFEIPENFEILAIIQNYLYDH